MSDGGACDAHVVHGAGADAGAGVGAVAGCGREAGPPLALGVRPQPEPQYDHQPQTNKRTREPVDRCRQAQLWVELDLLSLQLVLAV